MRQSSTVRRRDKSVRNQSQHPNMSKIVVTRCPMLQKLHTPSTPVSRFPKPQRVSLSTKSTWKERQAIISRCARSPEVESPCSPHNFGKPRLSQGCSAFLGLLSHRSPAVTVRPLRNCCLVLVPVSGLPGTSGVAVSAAFQSNAPRRFSLTDASLALLGSRSSLAEVLSTPTTRRP